MTLKILTKKQQFVNVSYKFYYHRKQITNVKLLKTRKKLCLYKIYLLKDIDDLKATYFIILSISVN